VCAPVLRLPKGLSCLRSTASEAVSRAQPRGACRRDAIRLPCCRPCWSARTSAGQCKHYAYNTEEAYTNWIKRYIYFHDVRRHLAEMGGPEVQAFLTHLAVEGNVAASTQNQVISREDGSGTRAVFEGLVMRDRRVTPTALIMPSSEAARDYFATHDGAIGYLSIGYLSPGVAALAIDGVRPEREAVENGTYAITRPFLLVSHPDPEPEVANFMEFARSPAGQAIVGQTYGRASTGVRR
jgi:hypothetical protein